MTDRSYLFVPGDRPERFDKACGCGAHAVVLDLEDAVLPENKAEAREHVRAWLAQGGRAYVRVNGTDTEWFDADCGLFAADNVLGVMLPKADNREQIEAVTARFTRALALIPLIESAIGLCNARAIAEVEGVQRLAFGSVDFQMDAGIEGDGEALLYSRSKLVVDSRAAGVDSPIDGVTLAVKDTDAVARDVQISKRIGMGGKLCIHPAQVTPVNAGFMPSTEDVEWARDVLEALEAQPAGVATFKGKVIDKPVIERARRIVAAA